MYGVWVIGASWGNLSNYYGAFPRGLQERIAALYPDVPEFDEHGKHTTLHAFAGSVKAGPYLRLDVNPHLGTELVGSVYDVASLIDWKLRLVIADPPYTNLDAEKYGTPMPLRRRCLAALAQVTRPGGHLVWLDTQWPIYRKTEWRTVGRIMVQRSTNHRIRVLTIFERL
jgi:hypothetical protein